MKKADIKPGVVYAYQSNADSIPEPVVFLSTDLYRATQESGEGPWITKAPPGAMAMGDSLGRRIGYPVVMRNWADDAGVPDEDLIRQMLALTAASWEGVTEVTAGSIRFMILMQLRHIIGPYSEVMTERCMAEQESRTRAIDVLTSLRAHGIEANRIPAYSAVDSITLPLAEAEKLIALLAAKDAQEG